MPTQPNILFIITDQQYAGAMSCAGNPDVNTPHMDSLAQTGTRFTRAYCTHPLCGPQRAATEAAEPPEEPPGARDSSHGLSTFW